MALPKFKFVALQIPEYRVFNVNFQKDLTVDGNLIEIGKHTVVLSGLASLTDADRDMVFNVAQEQDDQISVDFQGEYIVGPLWEKVNQCSFIISAIRYYNVDSDEDDWQGWGIYARPFDLVDEGGKKRIRLNFAMTQYGQGTHFHRISYKVTATGELANVTETPPGPGPGPGPSPSPSECDKRWVIGDMLASGEQSAAVGPSNAKDGNLTTRWVSPTTGSVKPWIQFNRTPNESTPTCRVDIAWADGTAHKYKFNVDVSTDGSDWTNVLSNKESTGTTTDFEQYSFEPVSSRYLKITITESVPGAPTVVAQISEIRVFGNA